MIVNTALQIKAIVLAYNYNIDPLEQISVSVNLNGSQLVTWKKIYKDYNVSVLSNQAYH